jgi:uncharacterized protein YgiM (DUF1202 family)
MKKNLWLVCCSMVSLSLVAQPVTNPPPAPAIQATNSTTSAGTTGATNAPATKSAKKKSGKKSEKKAATAHKAQPEIQIAPLVAGNATVIASNVNVRGQSKLKSEVITRLNKGQTVAVLEEVKLKNSGPDEPSAWAHIILPAKTPVWVNTRYIDAATKTATSKLKIRGGPGENYSVLGIMKKGDTITEISTKGDWTEIEAPAEASAFVAARYLSQEEAPAVIASNTTTNTPSTTVTEPPPASTNIVADATAVAPPPTNAPPVVAANTSTNTTPDQTTNTTAAVPEIPEPKPDEPPPRRVVMREGIVRGTFSIQAPTHFELINPDNRRTIDYLHSTSPSLDLSQYKGLRIVVTGEEGLDERWGNTPVITIQKIQVVE